MTFLDFCCSSISPDDPLIWVRAVHYAATVSVAGAIFFQAFIAEPAFRKAAGNGSIAEIVQRRLEWVTWLGLAVTVLSGAVWFILVTANMLDLPVADIFSGETMWTAATETAFGRDWIIRLVLAALVTGSLLPFGNKKAVGSGFRRLIAVGSAAGLVGALAWAGHGAAGLGVSGAIHLGADILHLITAAAWIGALVPLALLLGAAGNSDELSIAVVRDVALRFSTFGIASVATLLATGMVNTWMLVGGFAAFVSTDYGRVLSVKIALFLGMLSIAGVNRMVLTPRLLRADGSSARICQHRLRINSLIEAMIGAIIVIIVGLLGILPPGMQRP